MKKLNRFTIEQRAQYARKNEICRIIDLAFAATTDWLRQRHEGALRRPLRQTRMRSANATPA